MRSGKLATEQMAFKRSAVRSRLSPPKTIDFIWNRWFFYIFQPVLCWAFLPWTTNGQQTFLISSFLLWEGRSYGICQRRNNHAGLPFPGSPAFFYSRYFSASSCGRWPPAGRLFMPEVCRFVKHIVQRTR